jgi:hypothetical protein
VRRGRWNPGECGPIPVKMRDATAAKRRRLGLSVKRLAHILGMTRDTYYNAMRGDVVSPETRTVIDQWINKEN